MAQNTVNHGEGLRLPETSSRCVTDGAIHNFELNNWALMEGMGVGQFVTSSNFNAGGYDWNRISSFTQTETERILPAMRQSSYLVSTLRPRTASGQSTP
jgi:hypothetical protein